MRLEAKLYNSIENFVTHRYGCHVVKQQVGTKFGQVDVMGLRETSGDLKADGELIAIEVKEEKAPFLSAIGQAFAYSIYAHRCYLAYKKRYNNKFSTEEIDIATQFGVGLIEIKSNECNEIVTSRIFSPQEKYVLHILNKLKLFKCTLCRGIYHKEDMAYINKNGSINLEEDLDYPGRLENAIMKRKNAMYWLYELSHLRGNDRDYVYDRRFICKDCISIFSSLIKSD